MSKQIILLSCKIHDFNRIIMRQLLERISWITRRWNYSFSLLDLYLNDHHDSWGFGFFSFSSFRTYSFLRLTFRLPNMTNVRRFSIDEWDILFLHNFLWKAYDSLSDRQMWSRNLTRLDRIKLNFLSKIFK